MAKEKVCSCLETLKQEYEKFKKKYDLPEFQKLNEEFEIEKIAEQETDFLLREIRKAINEKAMGFLRFLELILNPTNAPFFMFTILRNLNSVDKKLVENIYEKICGFEIEAISLDLAYSEKKEAEFIKNAAKKWGSMREDLLELSEVIEKAWKASSDKGKKDYLG